jgi:hypothetical protein
MKPKKPYDAPSPDTLYIDSALPTLQIARIERLVARVFGDVRTMRTPVRFSDDDQGLEIPGVLQYAVRRGTTSPPDEVANYLYVWLSKPVQDIALNVQYNEPGHLAIRYSGTNSLSAEFRLTDNSPD